MTAKRKSKSRPAFRDWGEPIESPLDRYPGSVSFPPHFTLGHRGIWEKANATLQELDKQTLHYMTDRKNEAGQNVWMPFTPEYWIYVKRFIDMSNLENMPASTLDNGSDAPDAVARWLIPLVIEYITEHMFSLKNS